ncbi:MAG: hypothetical protein IJC46_08235 [Clostridia bacterium]|nr:hypothetical protein [Clostridia bacterium]
MKRILATCMILLMLLAMAGCGKNEGKTAQSATAVVAKDEETPQAEGTEIESNAEPSTDSETVEGTKEGTKPPAAETDLPTKPSEEAQAETKPPQPSGDEESPLLKRNTELEQKLVGSWSTQYDFGEAMTESYGTTATPGQYAIEMHYIFEANGKVRFSYDETHMRPIVRQMLVDSLTKSAAEQGMSLEASGVTDELIEQSTDMTVSLLTMALQPMDYAIYDENVLWFGGTEEGTLLEVTAQRILLEDSDGKQMVLTRN